jgi:hypothetical protein
MVVAAWTAERCDAPLVQPRFLEAAAAMRAAGDDREAAEEEAREIEHAAGVQAGRDGHPRARDVALGVAAGLAVGLALRRRR